jgi:hypothetical protein
LKHSYPVYYSYTHINAQENKYVFSFPVGNLLVYLFICLTNFVAPKTKGSSPHSQQPANDPYAEPGESALHPPTNLPKVHFDPILSSAPWPFKRSFSFGLSYQSPVRVSPQSHACHMPCLFVAYLTALSD